MESVQQFFFEKFIIVQRQPKVEQTYSCITWGFPFDSFV
jgi:hypothetical protein